MNATATNLQSSVASATYINPLRLQSASTNPTTNGNFMYYDTTAKEVMYLAPKLNAGFPLTLALDGPTDIATTLNGNATYLGSYVIVSGGSVSVTSGVVTSILAVTIPIGVSIINITETLAITGAAATFTRMRRTLSTAGTIGSPATGTVGLDQTTGPSTVGTYQTVYTFTVINATSAAISGSYVVNHIFSTGTIAVTVSSTTIKIA
jgi:hypothetical protein